MAIKDIINEFEKETAELKSLLSKKPVEFTGADDLRIYKWIIAFKELMFQTYISEQNYNELLEQSKHFQNLKWMINQAEALLPFIKNYQYEQPRVHSSK